MKGNQGLPVIKNFGQSLRVFIGSCLRTRIWNTFKSYESYSHLLLTEKIWPCKGRKPWVMNAPGISFLVSFFSSSLIWFTSLLFLYEARCQVDSSSCVRCMPLILQQCGWSGAFGKVPSNEVLALFFSGNISKIPNYQAPLNSLLSPFDARFHYMTCSLTSSYTSKW